MYFQSHLHKHLASKNIQALAQTSGIARSTLVRLKEGENQGKIVRLDCQVVVKLMASLSCQFDKLFKFKCGDDDRTGNCSIVQPSKELKFYSQLPQILQEKNQSLQNKEAICERLGIGWATLRLYLAPNPLTILDARTLGKILFSYDATLFEVITLKS